VQGVALTLTSALLYGLAFPPWRLWPLAWVALWPLFAALQSGSTMRALALAWLWIFAWCGLVVPWFPSSVTDYFDQPEWVEAAILFGVPTFMGAIDYMLVAVCLRKTAYLRAPWRCLVAGAAWVGGELGRTKLLTGNPWALLAYTQAEVAPIVQIADLTGLYGISFVIACFNSALSELGSPALVRSSRREGWKSLAVAAGLAFGVILYGETRMRLLERASPATPLGIVQSNVDPPRQWQPEHYGANLHTHLVLTRGLLRDARPKLVIWPENAFAFYVEDDFAAPRPRFRDEIAEVLRTGEAQLLAGGPRASEGRFPPYYNSAFLISAEAKVLSHYDKRYPLPFAEEFPFPDVEALDRRFGRVRPISPGTSARPLPTAAGAAGVLICNEVFFPEIAGATVRAGAEFLVNLANDSWSPSEQYRESALDMVRLRAVEQRRYLVRASTSGPSAIVDPLGEIAGRTGAPLAATLAGAIAPRRDLTVYARYGDWFAYLCAAVAIAATLRGVTR
jgi:apolipoprotein N-acyltransferase